MRKIALTKDIATCLALRHTVFVEEQGVSLAEEQDGRDAEALHFLARVHERPVGTARILRSGSTAKVGRVCVLRDARGTGLGAALIEACLDHLRGSHGVERAELAAQIDALGFYESLGFEAYGQIFDDAGIAHRNMVRRL